MPRTRFGDSAIEQEVLAQPQYRRAVWGARIAFPLWVACMLGLVIDSGAWSPELLGWLFPVTMVPLGFAVFNVFVLNAFITGDKGYRTLPISAPAANDLFWRTVNQMWLEALFITRRKRINGHGPNT
ncbi:hypothetical protein AB0B28_21235 [Glycomyces sp. NPDC046736]|uniref:hypothetical protein n=1 Tax=Glycomyces sp. NPDC046736 TaxID=3155615 RepID=UPI00340EEB93